MADLTVRHFYSFKNFRSLIINFFKMKQIVFLLIMLLSTMAVKATENVGIVYNASNEPVFDAVHDVFVDVQSFTIDVSIEATFHMKMPEYDVSCVSMCIVDSQNYMGLKSQETLVPSVSITSLSYLYRDDTNTKYRYRCRCGHLQHSQIT